MFETFQEIIDNHLNSRNILKGFMIGMGLRYAIDMKSNLLEIAFAILAPGSYCGLHIFDMYKKYR